MKLWLNWSSNFQHTMILAQQGLIETLRLQIRHNRTIVANPGPKTGPFTLIGRALYTSNFMSGNFFSIHIKIARHNVEIRLHCSFFFFVFEQFSFVLLWSFYLNLVCCCQDANVEYKCRYFVNYFASIFAGRQINKYFELSRINKPVTIPLYLSTNSN